MGRQPLNIISIFRQRKTVPLVRDIQYADVECTKYPFHGINHGNLFMFWRNISFHNHPQWLNDEPKK